MFCFCAYILQEQLKIMASLTQEQQAVLLNKYWDLHDENNMLKLLAKEKDETIQQLRRELVNAKNKIARQEQMINPNNFLASL